MLKMTGEHKKSIDTFIISELTKPAAVDPLPTPAAPALDA